MQKNVKERRHSREFNKIMLTDLSNADTRKSKLINPKQMEWLFDDEDNENDGETEI